MARPSRRQPDPEPSDDDAPEDEAPAEGLEGFLQANLAATPTGSSGTRP